MRIVFVGAILFVLVAFLAAIISTTMGAGGFKRMVKLTGVYSVCKPDGYDVVCFLDADSKEGGMFCLPIKTITPDGVCKK